ncbi:hypothetical protein QPM17_06605 [Marinobacter sp. TBZ242]|uniref:Uncharacterized protein n=1 Tax=Marinobacter azerbaijanicus TaxID=3050455 RepID=A0ABT7IAU5_9GAMM|nr:hypothetical protein [Marinobacter sp. TBZ242]MDL0430785.1 hypothetical protein [Marinobacter sp. TBZ242]
MPSNLAWYLLRSAGFLLAGLLFFGSAAAQDSERRELVPAEPVLRIDPEALSRIRLPELSVQVPQDLRPSVRETMEITDLRGRVLQESISPGSENINLNVQNAEAFIARPRGLVTLDLTARRTALPGGLIQPDRSESAREGDTIWFRPTASASPIPAIWDPVQERYRTHLLLGLQTSDPDNSMQPKQPVVLRLAFRGMDAEPVGPVKLEKAGVEHDHRILLNFRPTTDRPVVELRTDLGRYDLNLDVVPRLVLRPDADSMDGLGLGTLDVVVVRHGRGGDESPVSAPTEVFVETSGARKMTDRVIIPAGQANARFQIRSSGLGTAEVRASVGGLEGSTSIQQNFPYLPVTSAVLGGAIGGFCRRFQRKAPRSSDLMRILEGVLVAIVGYAVSVVGIMQLGVPPALAATEAGAFITGVIAGFVGVAVIEALTRRMGSEPEPR